MSLRILDQLEQGSDEWHAARRGMVTASTVGKLLTLELPSPLVVACPKCKAAEQTSCISLARKEPTPIATCHDERAAKITDLPREVTVADNDTSRALTATLAAERIAGWTDDTPMTFDMFRGVEMEPVARDLYTEHHQPVTQVGFMIRQEDGWTLGYSPDGLVGDDGLIEVKAPRTKGHMLTVIDGAVPTHYMAQLQAGLLVSGRKWVDFLPFVSGMPLWTKRVYPDPAWHAAIVAACRRFETTAAEMVTKYHAATAGLPVTERISDPFSDDFKVAS